LNHDSRSQSYLKGLPSLLQTITFNVDIVESLANFQLVKLQGFTDLKRTLAIQKLYKIRR